jgi:hypothetical protein
LVVTKVTAHHLVGNAGEVLVDSAVVIVVEAVERVFSRRHRRDRRPGRREYGAPCSAS